MTNEEIIRIFNFMKALHKDNSNNYEEVKKKIIEIIEKE